MCFVSISADSLDQGEYAWDVMSLCNDAQVLDFLTSIDDFLLLICPSQNKKKSIIPLFVRALIVKEGYLNLLWFYLLYTLIFPNPS